MKTEEEIIEKMKKDTHWRLPNPEDFGMNGDEILKRESLKFMAEVRRRMKIQETHERNEFEKKNSQIYIVLRYLDEERKKLMKHYNQDIHGKENWKSFEKAESITYVSDILLKFDERLIRNQINPVNEYNKLTNTMIKIRCPKCGGPVFDTGPDGSEESYECTVCDYYFLQGPAQTYLDEIF